MLRAERTSDRSADGLPATTLPVPVERAPAESPEELSHLPWRSHARQGATHARFCVRRRRKPASRGQWVGRGCQRQGPCGDTQLHQT
jgi:hypothetical protein